MGFLPHLLQSLGEQLGGLGAGDGVLVLEHEEGHPGDADRAGGAEIGEHLGADRVIVEGGPDGVLGQAVAAADRHQHVRVTDRLAAEEVGCEQVVLHCGDVGPGGAPGQMQQLVAAQRIGRDEVLEVVRQADGGRLLRHHLEHLPDLLGRHLLDLGEVFRLGAVVAIGQIGIQLVGPPGHPDVVPVGEAGQCRLEPALADVAPRAGDVGPDVDVHMQDNRPMSREIPVRAEDLTGRDARVLPDPDPSPRVPASPRPPSGGACAKHEPWVDHRRCPSPRARLERCTP
ncbi:hypothetical protein SDC9_71617 [bioreactor metagenome]|uniref:Uncharacterized protein n=1 Tax=bioreactor metagenome TaxID=1076179 RepID=A0A644YAB1_9ZZZZ